MLRMTLGNAQNKLGRHEEAEQTLTECLAAHRRVMGAEAIGTVYCYESLFSLYVAMNEFEKMLDAARQMGQDLDHLSDEHQHRQIAYVAETAALSLLGRFDESEAMLLERYEQASPKAKPFFASRLVRLYNSSDRADEAAIWQERAK